MRVKTSSYAPSLKIRLKPLPPPIEKEQGAVDGGGGVIKLEGRAVLYVARAALVSKDGIERDLVAEVSPWESKPVLEAMRSYVEMEVAKRYTGELLVMDGSYYTALNRWLQRIIRIALMKAKVSEIVSLPYTLLALQSLIDVVKRGSIFIAKNPRFRVFKEYLILKKLYESTGKDKFFILMKEPRNLKKDLIEYLHDDAIKPMIMQLMNPSLYDSDMLEGEGVSFGLQPGMPRALRRFLSPPKLKEIVEMARESYRLTIGEEAPEVNLEDLCFLKSPVIWWVRSNGFTFTIEEPAGDPLCLASIRKEVNENPKSLPYLIGFKSSYNPWLTMAHVISTVRGEQLLTYAKLVKAKMGLGGEIIREELLYASRAR